MNYKYFIRLDKDSFYSNSRNARKHLLENGGKSCYVFANTENAPLISMALAREEVVLVGAVKGVRA